MSMFINEKVNGEVCEQVNEAPKRFSVFNALQREFLPYRDVWQTPAQLKLDQSRLKYSAISRFEGASSVEATEKSSKQEPIPMWIADMDIPPCEDILNAITQNLGTTYGYQSLGIGEAVAKRYNHNILKYSKSRVVHTDVVDVASVIGAVDVALRTFCEPGQKVMVLTPTYSPLTESIKNNALQPLYLPLLKPQCSVEGKLPEEPTTNLHKNTLTHDVDENSAGIDVNALDKTAAAFVLCHPNNPTGTVLNEKEQKTIIDFCAQYNILLITDEVHSEFAFNSSNEPSDIPMFGAQSSVEDGIDEYANDIAAALPRIIHINSVSKAFNLASIPGASYAIIKDQITRERFAQAINARHLNASHLGKVALIAAYEKGCAWLDTVKNALSFNRKLVRRFFEHYGIQVKYTMGNAGYFLWLDLSSFSSHVKTVGHWDKHSSRQNYHPPLQYSPVNSVQECTERGVIGNDGSPFGSPHHIRLNLACHPIAIETALQRICFNA